MRAEEFLQESASVGSTAAGNVATVVKPLTQDKAGQSFFGGDADEFPAYGDISNVVIIRRPSPTAEATKRTK